MGRGGDSKHTNLLNSHCKINKTTSDTPKKILDPHMYLLKLIILSTKCHYTIGAEEMPLVGTCKMRREPKSCRYGEKPNRKIKMFTWLVITTSIVNITPTVTPPPCVHVADDSGLTHVCKFITNTNRVEINYSSVVFPERPLHSMIRKITLTVKIIFIY